MNRYSYDRRAVTSMQPGQWYRLRDKLDFDSLEFPEKIRRQQPRLPDPDEKVTLEP